MTTEDYVLVPREATKAMVRAAHKAGIFLNMSDAGWEMAWAAMLSASPQHIGSPLRGAEWQPIETAPKDGASVLIGHPCGLVTEAWLEGNEWAVAQDDGSPETNYIIASDPQPTHWMTLPLPPVGGSSISTPKEAQ